MARVCLYYLTEPERDRWIPGDRRWRPGLRSLLRGKPVPGGVERVFLNLRLGLDRLGAGYVVNLPFSELRAGDRVGVIGRGRKCLEGYDKPNPIVAGVALMTHPSEWPGLFEEHPVALYLCHSEWVAQMYRRYFGPRCALWPVGIDTEAWRPADPSAKDVDLLIYDKFLWNRPQMSSSFLKPVTDELDARGLTHLTIRYGAYRPADYRRALDRSRAMIFLCEHESQGLAYQEALACNVPVFAWDQGLWLDPLRFGYGDPVAPASSTPLWDARCGLKFADLPTFREGLGAFIDNAKSGAYRGRDFILDSLTVEKSSQLYLDILASANA